MKCLALYVDFNGLRFDPLGSRSLRTRASNLGTPWKRAISATVD